MIFTALEHKRRLWREATRRYRERHPRLNYLREWQAANREKCRAYTRKWRERNPEKAKQLDILYCATHRAERLAAYRKCYEKHREQRRQYRKKHAEEMRAYGKEFRRKHPERNQRYKQARRALEANTTVSKNLKAMERIYARAKELRQWFDVCVDHIVPLCKGGSHAPSNLQIIYKSENLIKARRLDYKPRVIFK
jgi:hypothetical protein